MGIVLLLQLSPMAPIDVLSIIWTIIALTATYSYAYHKRILKPKYWRIFMWFIIFLVVLSLIEIFILPPGFLVKTFPILKSNVDVSTGATIFSLLFMLPSLYAIYKLSLAKH